MEEDIKILENSLMKIDKKSFNNAGYIITDLTFQEFQAIENLIARNKELEEKNDDMKALLNIQASIAKELEFDTPDKMTRFKDSYYIPDTMKITADIGKPKRLELSYVDVSKFLEE